MVFKCDGKCSCKTLDRSVYLLLCWIYVAFKHEKLLEILFVRKYPWCKELRLLCISNKYALNKQRWNA